MTPATWRALQHRSAPRGTVCNTDARLGAEDSALRSLNAVLRGQQRAALSPPHWLGPGQGSQGSQTPQQRGRWGAVTVRREGGPAPPVTPQSPGAHTRVPPGAAVPLLCLLGTVSLSCPQESLPGWAGPESRLCGTLRTTLDTGGGGGAEDLARNCHHSHALPAGPACTAALAQQGSVLRPRGGPARFLGPGDCSLPWDARTLMTTSGGGG